MYQLPALKSLCITFDLTPGALTHLAKALAKGTAPQLQELLISNADDFEFEAFADMIEARARRVKKVGLQYGWCWFDKVWPATQVRLLRALLLSSKKFGTFTWQNWFEPYFLIGRRCCGPGQCYAKSDANPNPNLCLEGTNMGDEGIVALACLVEQDRFKQLNHIDLSRNEHITDRSLILLAKAIGRCGLPMLERFMLEGLDTSKVTAQGAAAIGQVLINGSLKLNILFMRPTDFENCIYSSVI